MQRYGRYSIIALLLFTLVSLPAVEAATKSDQTQFVSKDLEIETDKNILLLGYGGAGHDGGNLSDVLIVFHIDKDKKEATLISVPRDLWVEIPIRSDISENYKINAAYAIGTGDKKYGLKEPQYRGEIGGGNMAKKVVAGATGLSIDHFIAVDFEGFKKIVDSFGGLDVDVPVTFDDYFYPVKGLENETCGLSSAKIAEFHQMYSGFEHERQFTCRYEHIHFDKGLNHIDGETALKYVRSRHSDQHGGDFARSQRQQALLLAIKDKLISINAVGKVDELFGQFSKTGALLGERPVRHGRLSRFRAVRCRSDPRIGTRVRDGLWLYQLAMAPRVVGMRRPNTGFLLSSCAAAVALTRVVGSQIASLTHVAAGETMPAAQAPSR